MKQLARFLVRATVCTVLALPHMAAAQTAPAIPPALVTPDKVETRIGPLQFKDGAPSAETVDKIYDNLDFTHAFEESRRGSCGDAIVLLVCLDVGEAHQVPKFRRRVPQPRLP